MRIAIVGDIGGQLDLFKEVVEKLGGNPDTGVLPKDLTVIQIGDIVRMNISSDLDSLGCALYADTLINVNEGRYIQMIGNHETPLLEGVSDPHWKIHDLPDCREIIEHWHDSGKGHYALALHDNETGRDILLTHAGLTSGYLYHWLESPLDASAAVVAREYNKRAWELGVINVENPGGLVTGIQTMDADAQWAKVSEVHDSWRGLDMPFDQIHGHSVAFRWDAQTWWPEIQQDVIDTTIVDETQRYTLTKRNDGTTIRSVDWVLGNDHQNLNPDWSIFYLEDAEILLPR